MIRMTALACALIGATQATADNHIKANASTDLMRTAAPEGAEVFFISPVDGSTVSNPVTLQFGARGIGIAPAGVEWPNTGHHHLLINVDPATLDLDYGLPADDQHRHFGGGQTQVTLDLPVGTHSIFLLMGDQNHVPHDPPIMSGVISITVQ